MSAGRSAAGASEWRKETPAAQPRHGCSSSCDSAASCPIVCSLLSSSAATDLLCDAAGPARSCAAPPKPLAPTEQLDPLPCCGCCCCAAAGTRCWLSDMDREARVSAIRAWLEEQVRAAPALCTPP